MLDKNQLCKFLIKAKKSTYASGDLAKEIIESDKSTSLLFIDGDWKYHDNYFGGEPYGGRELVFFKDKPIYIMTYYGSVNNEIINIKEVYKILQQALSLIPEEYPYRGPKEYSFKDYIYLNYFNGEIDNFSGEEIIKFQDNKIYKAKYMGGFVNQRK